MFERFTDDARAIVVDAQAQARALGHQAVGTEHLLLSLADIFNSLQISFNELERSVDAHLTH